MSEAKFTKGEWFVVNTDDETTVTCASYDICTVWNGEDVRNSNSNCGRDICTVWNGEDDAHLIVAASEMYKAIEYQIEFTKGMLEFWPLNPSMVIAINIQVKNLESLLAKARGES